MTPTSYVECLFSLDGRVAVVTGGGSGIGAAISVGCARAGASVAVLDVDESGCAATVSEIEAAGGRALGVIADVTDSGALDRAQSQVRSALGRATVLVNSAGTAFRSPAEEFPEEQFDRVMGLNLKGTYLACQTFGRVMLELGAGTIVNVASIGGFVAYPHASAYLASKGGVVQLTRALALEWIGKVRVNALAPTLFETPLTRAGAKRSTVTSEFISNRSLRRGRLGQPEEIVGAAIFLASEASALVTGHTLPVDDGYLIA
jgi:NAD(P)-dependent dehydrogenase (short-subunit alcohol dehydrogenase family)